MNSENLEINDKVKVKEITKEGELEWFGEITKISSSFIEVKYRRDIKIIPQHIKFPYTFETIWQKFYKQDKKLIEKI